MNYKLSPSDLTYLYEGCKCCFWLKVKHGIAQPSMPMPGIFSAIAGKQKEFYAGKRTEEFCRELPPGVVVYGEKPVQSKVIEIEGLKNQCHIRGRFDVVVQFDDGSYGVIDFKTASPSEEKAEMYGRQLQAYAYSLENPETGQLSLSPVTKLGLLFFEPFNFEQLNLGQQVLKGLLVWMEIQRNDDEFLGFLKEVVQVLESDAHPAPASDCLWCSYRDKLSNSEFSSDARSASQKSSVASCPQCDGPMAIKNGKYGEFWSCQRYPECKGTKKI